MNEKIALPGTKKERIERIGHNGKNLTLEEACVVALRANSTNILSLVEMLRDGAKVDASLVGTMNVVVNANDKLATQVEEAMSTAAPVKDVQAQLTDEECVRAVMQVKPLCSGTRFAVPDESEGARIIAAHRIEAERQAAERAWEEAMAWQPIETAPTDGTECLVWQPSDEDGDECIVVAKCMEGKWAECLIADYSAYSLHPTHWKALPPAPDSALPNPYKET